MSLLHAAVALAALCVALVAVALVLHPDYEDGLIGRVGLAAIAIAGAARSLNLLLDGGHASPIGVLLWFGLVLFFARHAYRFRKWRRCGEHEWRQARRDMVCGK